MNVFEIACKLIDVESITPNEERIGVFLHGCLLDLAEETDGQVECMQVEAGRHNVFASWGKPAVTLSTHMDTVPPHFPSRDDGENIWGRGACDTKGIIASMMVAAEEMLAEGTRDFGLLFVVGEERNSAGAFHAAKNPRGSRFLVNGEPTENKLALGSKGAMRFEVHAKGRMAHSAYPELGDSAIEKLLDALEIVRRIPLQSDELLGQSTLNVGTIRGGRAPNVIPDEAMAEVFIRLVDDGQITHDAVHEALEPRVEVRDVLTIPAIHLGKLDGFETTVVAYTTDIPAFGGAWGQPYLLGPGTIHVAHTDHEHVPKRQLEGAVQIYKSITRQLHRQ